MAVVARVWKAMMIVLVIWSAPSLVEAQAMQPLRGVVFDSLAKKPLVEATVRVIGAAAFAKTDDKGRFRLDSVALGTVELQVEHPMLDSIGLYELSARVPHDGKKEHRLGVPSMSTLSRAICGRELAGDSAFVYGAIKTPESQPARDADVVISWVGVSKTASGKLGQQKISYTTRTDSLGRYAACGLPMDEPYTFVAKGRGADSLAMLSLELPARSTPVLRHEVMLNAPIVAVRSSASNDGTVRDTTPRARPTGPTGVVRGTVVGTGGEPVPNTRVAIADVADIRTDSLGRFFIPDVPTGSRQIEAIAVGRNPGAQLITIKARDTTVVLFALERVTALKEIRTEATVLTEFTRGFEERKKTGIGRYRDSTELASSPSIVAVLSGFPSVVARTGRGGIPVVLLPKIASISGGVGQCVARLYVDGRPEQWERVAGVSPKEIAWMEVYARASILPAEFQVTTKDDACGVVSIVTKSRVAR